MSLKDKYNSQPPEPPKRKEPVNTKGNATVFSQMASDVEDGPIEPKRKIKKATFNMSADLHKRLKKYAAANEMDMKDVLEDALQEFMDKRESSS